MSEVGALDSDWVSVHAYYHGDLDTLVLGAVAPLVDELDADREAVSWFFLRYWDGGPHIRMRVLPREQSCRRRIENKVRNAFEEQFVREPAETTMDERHYESLARSLGRAERIQPRAKLAPNQSVEFVRYTREYERYGTGRTICLAERHFNESSALAVRMLRMGLSPTHRARTLLAFLLAAWFSYDDNPSTLVTMFSDSSSIDDWLGGGLGPASASNNDRKLWKFGSRILALTRRRESEDAAGTVLHDWIQSMGGLRDGLADEGRHGRFHITPRGWEGRYSMASGVPSARTLTVLDVCAHLMANRLGLSPSEETVVRHLAAGVLGDLAAGAPV